MIPVHHFLLISIAFLSQVNLILASPHIISGEVLDPKGNPVPNVSITLLGSDKGTTTNYDGRFYIVSSVAIDSIQIKHFAYLPITTAVSNSFSKFVLEPKLYRFSPITITGNIYATDRLLLPVSHTVISFQDSPAWGNSIAERLDRNGLQVKDYGGPAGLKTVSSPTGQSEHMLVMLDGLPLNSPQWGGVDLGNLPVEFIGQGELFWGQGSSIYGSGAVSGTLNLTTADISNTYIRTKSGSFGESSLSGMLSLPMTSGKISLFGTHYKNNGDFRENNDFIQNAAGLQFHLPLGKLWNSNFLTLWSDSERGQAGSETWLTPFARKYNKELLQIINLRGLSTWGQTNISLGRIDADEHYLDSNPDFPEESIHQVESLVFRATQRFSSPSKNKLITSIEGKNHFIKSDNTGTRTQLEGAVGLLSILKLSAQTNLVPSFRVDWNSNQTQMIPTGSVALLHTFDDSHLKSLKINMGTSYRYPTINELYWTDVSGMSQGNPVLQPEKGRSISSELTLDPFIAIISIQLRTYHLFTDNLIQWTADKNWVWSPQNISKSESMGASLQLDVQSEHLPIKLIFKTEQNQSRVLSKGNDQGKRLIYVPAVAHWLDLTWQLLRWEANLNYRFLGRRLYSYVAEKELKAYERWDAAVRYRGSKIGRVIPTVEMGVRNLTDKKDLQSVYGYPEPSRALFAQMTLRFH